MSSAAAAAIEPSADQSKPLEASEPRGKKPAWNRPSVAVAAADLGADEAVFGAASWPALSEAIKASPKSLPTDPIKISDHRSLAAPPMEPVNQTLDSGNPQPLSAVNHAAPALQRSINCSGGNGGGGGIGNNGDLVNGVAALVVDPPAAALVSPGAVQNFQISPRENVARSPSGNWDQRRRGGGSGLQGHGGGENHRGGHGGNRRGNNGGGGDRYGNRWDSERGGHDGYHNRGFGGRDGHMQQRGGRTFIRAHVQPAPPVTYFGHAQAVQAFGNPPIGYSELASPMYFFAPQSLSETLRPMPYMPHPGTPPPMPPMLVASMDHQAAILKQIEYYFSAENLCKDTYLRSHMDEHGWVPISVVAGFKKVKQLTDNISYILETVRLSIVLEVQGENMRRRGDWMKWVLPSKSSHYTAATVQQTPPTSGFDGQADGL